MANLLEHLKTDMDRIADTINPDTTNSMLSNLDRIANKLNTESTNPMASNLDKIAEAIENGEGGGGGGTDNTVKICKVKLVNGTSDTQYFDYTVISDNPLAVRLSIQDELLYYDTITLQPNDEVTVDCLVSVGNLDSEHPENLYYYVVCGLSPVSNLYSELNNVTLFDGVNPETQIHFLVPVITDITKPASFTYNV